jgi:Aminopeptidase N
MIFPCFDQPDIKASIKLSVVVPEEWKVLSNESVDKIKQVTPEFLNSHLFSESQAKTNLVEFQNTPTLASYHFVVAAGPYHKVECKSTHRNIKMSVYLRSSLANLDSEIIQVKDYSLLINCAAYF